MDVINPELQWLDNACFRVNHLHSDYLEGKKQKTHQFEDEAVNTYEDEEPSDDDAGIVKTKDGFSLSLSIPSAYFPYVIGAKGATRKRIETETETRIKIPAQGQEGDIVVLGNTPRSLLSVKSRLEIIVGTARQKQPFTHFISIPFTSPQIHAGFIRFQESVLRECRDRGVETSIFQTPTKLHLTIGTLALLNDAERKAALRELQNCDDILNGPIEVTLNGVEYMNDDPSEVDVLYACVAGPATDQLQELCDTIIDRLWSRGLMHRQYDSVKLHVTVMNTLFRSNKGGIDNELRKQGEEGVKKPRESFDARNILKKFKDFEFGKQLVTSVQLSTRYSTDKEGYYQSAGQLELVG